VPETVEFALDLVETARRCFRQRRQFLLEILALVLERRQPLALGVEVVADVLQLRAGVPEFGQERLQFGLFLARFVEVGVSRLHLGTLGFEFRFLVRQSGL
jgi:hypothetical protein